MLSLCSFEAEYRVVATSFVDCGIYYKYGEGYENDFGKLDKFEGHDFRRWQNKMHFLLTTLKVVYVLTTLMPELLENATVKAIRIRAKWENDDYICMGHILNGMSDSLFDVYKNVESAKELWDSLESKYMDEDSSSKKFLGKGKEVGGPSVNMTEEGGIAVVVKRTTQMLVVREKGLRTNPKIKVDAIAWWIDSGATTHVCKDRCWFKIFEPVEDGSVLYMGDEHFAPVHGKGSIALEFSYGKTVTLFNLLYVSILCKNLVSGPVLNKCGYKQVYESDKYILSKCGVFIGFGYYNNGHVHYKRMLEMSKDELIPAIDENFDKCTTCNKKYVITFIDDASRFCYVYLLHAKDEALDKFRIYKIEVELQQNDLIKTLRTNRGGEYYDPVFFQSVGVIHETTAPYIPQQNGVAERKNKALKEMQPKGFVMSGNEHKVCKLVKSLYGLKQAPKQWHQKFDEIVLSSDFHLNQSDKCVYSKFDDSDKGVITCLYVDDMLIFGTDQNQIDKTKKFLSSRFSMKDMGEADVILEKLKPNTGKPVDQLEYSRAIGFLMYAMTSTRPDIAYVVGRLSRFTSNPSRQHWKAITRIFKYLRGTKDYGLSYVGYPSELEGCSDANWINHVEDSYSTSGWVFLLGGGAISWASKKQTCITDSTMKSEFVALVAAGKEAEWLRNLIDEIPIWPKPIAPISIRCDSAPTMVREYS
nr:zinc finger, CCHC-type [Tanacetum cinerariifolium]